jgi:uncharacterized lipoprotein YmbA
MNNRFSRIKWIAAVLFSLILAGCIGGRSAPTQFYMLSPMPPTVATPATVNASIRIGLDPVEVPDYLDRPHMVTHLDRAEYQLDEFNQWLEPLSGNLTRVITENLSEMLQAEGIDILSTEHTVKTDYVVAVQILRLDGKRGQDMVLVARWSLFDQTDNSLPLTKRSVIQEAASDDTYQGHVKVQNRMIESLSREIADGIRPIVAQRVGA